MSKAVVPSSIVFEVLDEDNYEDWRETIEAYLKAQDLWDVVKYYQQPPKIEEDEAQFKVWKKKNVAALHAIKISCGPNMHRIIRGITEAYEAWWCLKSWFIVPPSVSKIQIFSGVQDTERLIADEENVVPTSNETFKSLNDAFSNSNFGAVIALCKNHPRLLKEKLSNDRLVLNELIILGGRDREDKVLEILTLEQFDVVLEYLSHERYFSNTTPLEVAVWVGAIEIARHLVQMNPTLLSITDTLGHIPLAVAVGSHMKEMANLLYTLTPGDFWTQQDNAAMIATVITKSFEVENLDIALKLLNFLPVEFVLTEDFNGKCPLYAAASAPQLFRRTYHHRFFPKHICKGMKLLIRLGDAIRDPTDDPTKIDTVCKAFFEAIRQENFNFILMVMNSIKRIVYLTDDKSRNMYMLAIAYRHAKLFSLFLWDKQDAEIKRDASLLKDKWRNNMLHMVGASTPPISFDRNWNPALQMKRELTWFMEIEKLLPDLVRKSENFQGKTPRELFKESHKDLMTEAGKWMKESTASWAIVCPLIITIMFAAAFQVPGGNNQDRGFPIFINKWLFKVYMVLVAVSLFSATIVLKFLQIFSANDEKDFLASLRTYNVITGTLFLSIATMMVAFCLGVFLTLHGELAIFLPIATFAIFLVGYIICRKLPLLVEILNFFNFVEVKIPFIKWRTPIFDRNIGHEVELIFKMLNRDSQ